MGLYIVTKQDTVVQVTSYIVRARDQQHAERLVNDGQYIEETKPETVDHVDTDLVSVEELELDSEGQTRNYEG